MGVSGAGKTTVGKMLAERVYCKFYDADQFHSKENIEKMSKGLPLTDEDRASWLLSLRTLIEAQSTDAVIACSSLKQSYRDILKAPGKDVAFIYLKGEKPLLQKRLQDRKGHYAGPDLLDGQLETLEEPEEALTINIVNKPEAIVEKIVGYFNL